MTVDLHEAELAALRHTKMREKRLLPDRERAENREDKGRGYGTSLRRCVHEKYSSDLKKLQAVQVGPEYHRGLLPELTGCMKKMLGADIYKLPNVSC